jgi:hypothetical protein
MKHLFRLLPCLLPLLFVAACEQQAPVDSPEAGLDNFAAALFAQDSAGLWRTLSPETQQLFAASYASLVKTKTLIARLPAADQAVATSKTGVSILERVSSPEQLFAELLYKENIPTEAAFVDGIKVVDAVQTDGNHATLVTTSHQVYQMVRATDGSWRVASPVHEALTKGLAQVESNRSNVEAAVEAFGSANRGTDVLLDLVKRGGAAAGSGEAAGSGAAR